MVDHKRAGVWLTTFVLLPLAPLIMSLVFRLPLENRDWSGALWCTEVPFFTLTLGAASAMRLYELSNDTSGASSEKLIYGSIAAGAACLLAVVFMGVYYVDTVLLTGQAADQAAQASKAAKEAAEAAGQAMQTMGQSAAQPASQLKPSIRNWISGFQIALALGTLIIGVVCLAFEQMVDAAKRQASQKTVPATPPTGATP